MDALNAQKIYVFLKYLFDERYLKEAVRDEWLKIYDKEVSPYAPCRMHGAAIWMCCLQDYACTFESMQHEKNSL